MRQRLELESRSESETIESLVAFNWSELRTYHLSAACLPCLDGPSMTEFKAGSACFRVALVAKQFWPGFA